jgi:hypothetical protein
VTSLGLEGEQGSADEIVHGPRRHDVVGPAERADPCRDVDCEAGHDQPLAFAGVDAGSHRHAGLSRPSLNSDRGANGARGGVEDREDAVTGRIHEFTPAVSDPCAAVGVVLGQKLRHRRSPNRATVCVESTMSVIRMVVRKRPTR